ncbi:MAG: hypothetical protein U0931_41690 [Vulcanimicrobiota bacterium]
MKSCIWILCIVMAATPSWGKPKQVKAEWVEIVVRPSEGRAGCRYQPDGHMKGYHLSGPPDFRVHEAEGQTEATVERAGL